MKASRIILFGIIGVAAVAFFVWLTNGYVFRSEAAQKKVTITMSTAGDVVNGSVPIKFVVQPQDPADLISGVDLRLQTSNGSIETWKGCASLEGDSSIFSELVNQTGKDARYSCVVLRDSKQLPKALVVTSTATCSTQNAMQIKVLPKTEVVGPVEGASYQVDNIGPEEINCGGGVSDGGKGDNHPGPQPRNEDILTRFTPEDCDAEVGGTCSYNFEVKARNGADHISSFYVKFAYNPKLVSFGDIVDNSSVLGTSTMLAQAAITPSPGAVTSTPTATPPVNVPSPTGTAIDTPTPGLTVTAAPVTGMPSPTDTPPVSLTPTLTPTGPAAPKGCAINYVDTTKPGEARLLYLCDGPMNKLPSKLSFQLTLKGLADGQDDIHVEGVQASGPDVNGLYSVGPSRAHYTIGKGGVSGNIKLNMKLRLQCVVAHPKGADTIKVRVGISNDRSKGIQYQTGDFKADEKGIWHGSVSFQAPTGGGYCVRPKAEKGMQKKVCEPTPKEDYPGAYGGRDKGTIVLKDGDNDLDFSNIVLLSGDLPPGEQDGISNAMDFALVRQLLGKNDADPVRSADINYDGIVSAVDTACLSAGAAVHWDE